MEEMEDRMDKGGLPFLTDKDRRTFLPTNCTQVKQAAYALPMPFLVPIDTVVVMSQL